MVSLPAKAVSVHSEVRVDLVAIALGRIDRREPGFGCQRNGVRRSRVVVLPHSAKFSIVSGRVVIGKSNFLNPPKCTP